MKKKKFEEHHKRGITEQQKEIDFLNKQAKAIKKFIKSVKKIDKITKKIESKWSKR